MESYSKLAHAIVVQSVKDWKEASKRPNSTRSKETKEECEKFFLSEWFTELSGLDGKAFLARLRKERVAE